MDSHQFDRITKSLFEVVSTRRGAVGVLAAGLASVGGTALGWRDAMAQDELAFEGVTTEANDPTCKGEASINNKRCPRNQCTRNRNCFCAKNINDQKRCVNLRNVRCPRRDECDRTKHCRNGQSCIKIGGCCRRQRNACVPLCGR